MIMSARAKQHPGMALPANRPLLSTNPPFFTRRFQPKKDLLECRKGGNPAPASVLHVAVQIVFRCVLPA
jgi:hypothetical protein